MPKTIVSIPHTVKVALQKAQADITALQNAPPGSGDMLRSVYDPNTDGLIAAAQLTGVPTLPLAQSDVTNLTTDLSGKTTLSAVKADTDIADAISKKHSNTLDHSNTLNHSNSLDHPEAHNHTGVYEAANANIQSHVTSGHAPANAQKNSDILKSEIEAVLTGQISSHSHAGGSPTGVLNDLQFSILQSDGTLNAALGIQTWSGTNTTSQDVFTLAANTTYLVRGQWYVNTGATSHTTAIAWALSGATVSLFNYQVLLWSAAANAIATVQSTIHVTGVASKVLNAASTAVYTIISFEGILVTGTGGTITPQINFFANPTGTNLMKAGSWISFSKLGTNAVIVAGGWA